MVKSKRIKGKSIQPYTQEHKNKTLALEIPLHTRETAILFSSYYFNV